MQGYGLEPEPPFAIGNSPAGEFSYLADSPVQRIEVGRVRPFVGAGMRMAPAASAWDEIDAILGT